MSRLRLAALRGRRRTSLHRSNCRSSTSVITAGEDRRRASSGCRKAASISFVDAASLGHYGCSSRPVPLSPGGSAERQQMRILLDRIIARILRRLTHDGWACDAHQRSRLEHLARYITRPAIAMDRLHIDERGLIVLELKNPFRDATTHILFTPGDFMARLAAGCWLANTRAQATSQPDSVSRRLRPQLQTTQTGRAHALGSDAQQTPALRSGRRRPARRPTTHERRRHADRPPHLGRARDAGSSASF
jgi:hypothetical protein